MHDVGVIYRVELSTDSARPEIYMLQIRATTRTRICDVETNNNINNYITASCVKSKLQNDLQTLSALPKEPNSVQFRRSAEQPEVVLRNVKLPLSDVLLSARFTVGVERSAVDKFSSEPLPNASPLLGL